MSRAALIIHAGAGARERTQASREDIAARLEAILAAVWPLLIEQGARSAVRAAVERLEDEPLFNAGTGSKLQADGQARMSAAIMAADDGVFSGVINVERIAHPVIAADRLHAQQHHVMAGAPANAWLSAQGFADHDPVTPQRHAEWRAERAGAHGTVGAVACDERGIVAAATSTGGVGMERPGRVSDSATVAGTYAGSAAAVSLTGVGEHIVNHAAAARIVTRCTDGLSLETSVARTLAEAQAREFEFGLIAVDAMGALVADQTAGIGTLYAARADGRSRTFVQAERLSWSTNTRNEKLIDD